jgi:apolipoprotein D and lipocalin family protein
VKSQLKFEYYARMKRPNHTQKIASRYVAASALAVSFVVILAGCIQADDFLLEPLPVVASVDVARYLGTWHQVAWIPNKFQRECVSNTKAIYTLDGIDLRVQNQCKDVNGKTSEAIGVAKIVEGSNNAKLRVSFFRPFYGNYWVLALDPDYKWVLVGEPKREFGWVLARDNKLEPATLKQILDRAVALGYDRAAFKMSP